MDQATFDVQFMAAYHQLHRVAGLYAHEDRLDLVHELYCKMVQRCDQFEYVNASLLWNRLRWLALEQYRQFPTYVELSETHPVQEPVEPSFQDTIIRDEIETWCNRDKNRAMAMIHPAFRTKSFSRYRIRRDLGPKLRFALTQAGLRYGTTRNTVNY